MIKERAFVANPHEVKSILAGKQTQFRRIVKQQPPSNYDRLFFESGGDYGWWWSKSTSGEGYSQQDLMTFPKHQFGKPGDRLWVREKHAVWHRDAWIEGGVTISPPERGVYYWADQGAMFQVGRWLQAVNMPRWASRILLEVESVRVERLQDISRDDIRVEGVMLPPSPRFSPTSQRSELHAEYYDQWDRANGPGSWEENPWVWVVTFKRIKP